MAKAACRPGSFRLKGRNAKLYNNVMAKQEKDKDQNSRPTQPTFEEWLAGEAAEIVLDVNSPRNLRQLYEDIYLLGEASIARGPSGEVVRHGKAVMIDVIYQDQNGKKYKLHEKRHKLQDGKTLEDFLMGDRDAGIPSPARPSRYSLSERMKLDGETAQEASIRAIEEELFASADLNAYPNWKQIVLDNLELSEPTVRYRLPKDLGNSYRGLASSLEEVHGQITFRADMEIPIARDESGKPQRLYEFVAEKGYVNLFEWNEIIEN